MSFQNPPCTDCGSTASTETGAPKPLGESLFDSRIDALVYRLGREQARPDENNQPRVAAGVEHKDGKVKIRVSDAARRSFVETYNLESYLVASENDPFSLVTKDLNLDVPNTPGDGQTQSIVRLVLGRLLDEV